MYIWFKAPVTPLVIRTPSLTSSRVPVCPPGTHHGATLWAGTNSGSVYAYALEVPGVGSGRGGAGEAGVCVEAVLGKEIQLMHRAPVVSISVLDGRGKPLPDPYEASQDLAIAPDMTNAHSVLIASEEQLKVKKTGKDQRDTITG